MTRDSSKDTDDGVVTRLVISDGDLPGLVAAVIASEETVRQESLGAGMPVVWATGQTDAVSRQAVSLGMRLGRRDAAARDGAPGSDAVNRLLLDAGMAALGLRCPVVVWPIVLCGPEPDRPAGVEAIADAVNRATLVSRLVSLDASDAGIPEVRIETPFVDLSDQQIAELACEMGVRFEDCWWWNSDSSDAGRARARWGPLLPMPA